MLWCNVVKRNWTIILMQTVLLLHCRKTSLFNLIKNLIINKMNLLGGTDK